MKRIGRPRIRRWSTERLIRLALAHGTSNRGWDAVAQLHRRGSPATLARVEALMRSPGVRQRALALDIAAQLRVAPHGGADGGEPYALEAAQAMLVAALADPRPCVLQSAIAGLGHQPVAGTLAALLGFVDHPDVRVRWALTHTLAEYPEPEAVAALLRLSSDRDDAVRDWATFSLGTLSDADDEAVRARLWANAHDPNRDVRGEAVVGLARRSDPRAVDLLRERLVDGDCRVYELEAAEEMPRAELLGPLQALHADAERTRRLEPYWYRKLLDALDACATVADAQA